MVKKINKMFFYPLAIIAKISKFALKKSRQYRERAFLLKSSFSPQDYLSSEAIDCPKEDLDNAGNAGQKIVTDIERRYNLVPQLRDSDGLSLEWHPYVMRWTQPNYQSASLNTDEMGFRVTLGADGNPLTYQDFLQCSEQRAIFSGNSTAFGIGTSSDGSTVPSILNKHHSKKITWYNFSMRAFNLTQERLATDFYAPWDASHFVLLSGLNNLVVALLGQGGSKSLCPFVGEPTFMQTFNQKTLAEGQLPAFDLAKDSQFKETLQIRYQQVLASTERDLALISMTRGQNCKILFCLQPALAWTEKPLSEEEKTLVEIWDNSSSILHQIHTDDFILPWRERLLEDLETICGLHGIDFLDLNSDAIICGNDWIFADRVHLVDKGHARVAMVIREWVDRR